MPELARIPFTGLDAPPAVFRTMIRMSRQAVDRVGAGARRTAGHRRGSPLPAARAWRRSAAAAESTRVLRAQCPERDRDHRATPARNAAPAHRAAASAILQP